MEENTKSTEAAENTAEATETEKKTQKKTDTKALKAELAAANAELEAKNNELAEQSDKYLRMMAEYDNFRKRSAKERDGIYSDAVCDSVGDILSVVDNLERAAIYSDAEKVAEGLALTAKSVHTLFEKLGIEQTASVGDTFDPNLHNAVMHIEDEEHKEGEILEVFQKGYRKGDKIIRYAMVKVAN